MKGLERLYNDMQEDSYVISKLGFADIHDLIRITNYSRAHVYRLLSKGKEANRILDIVAITKGQ